MEINQYNEYGDISFDYEQIINDIIKVFEEEMQVTSDASLILVNEAKIQEINKMYRQKDYPTDVISFEDASEEGYIGDIFLCVDKVYSQAKEYGHSVEREFAFLLCHGLLHLLGYDHMSEEEEKEMFKMQDVILNKTKYRRM